MKIAILGGGFTGLTAAYYLQRKGHQVTVFEKETILGGLASGFKIEGWVWSLERAYHHIFANDNDILSLAHDTGFKGFFFREPETASIYIKNNISRIIPIDTPQDFLLFPFLPWVDKLRAAAVLAFLKVTPFLPLFENMTAQEFLQKTMGDKVWNILWQELFRKKFGKYAGNILASFIWARIKKRTKKLGYVEAGFQTFIDYVAKTNQDLGVKIEKGKEVTTLVKKDGVFIVNDQRFDAVISTLPTPVLLKTVDVTLPKEYKKRLSRLKYLHAVNLILETEAPILDKTYWLNSTDAKLPFMVVVQQTNYIDKQYYGNKHIAYVAEYVDTDNKLLKMDKEEIIKYYLPYLNKISHSSISISRSFLFKAPFAQPIFDKDFVKNKPDFITPVKNFYIANLDMTYPYDRGTNYAVKLGREVAKLIE